MNPVELIKLLHSQHLEMGPLVAEIEMRIKDLEGGINDRDVETLHALLMTFKSKLLRHLFIEDQELYKHLPEIPTLPGYPVMEAYKLRHVAEGYFNHFQIPESITEDKKGFELYTDAFIHFLKRRMILEETKIYPDTLKYFQEKEKT